MKKKTIILIAVITGILTGGILVLLFPVGNWWMGWLSGTILMTLATLILLTSLDWLKAGKEGLWLTIAAFAIRLVIGIGLMLALPVWGYDNDVQNAGYVFKDAYNRDTATYDLVASGNSLFSVFNEEFFTDQYGGLAFISALVYRVFSLDAHRPYLMLVVSSLVFAQGIPFFYTAIKKRFDPRLALIASWIVVLYPEGIFFTASQMREPFMIGGAMVLLWGMLTWFEKEKPKQVLLVCVPTVIVMLGISWLMLGAALLVLGVWFGIEWVQKNLEQEKQKFGYLVLFMSIVLILGAMLFLGSEWLRYTIWWDMREMLLSSGHMEIMVEGFPEPVQYTIITVYGVLQMIPPAALIEASAPIWTVISTLRSVGWYLFLPVLGFGFYAVWKKENRKERILIAWLLAFTWGWTLFSSLRGGGDTWDNPRYRMLALPMMAILVVWLWRLRDHWFWRIVAAEVFGLIAFSHWYIARYWDWWSQLPIKSMVVIVAAGGIAILVSGIWAEVKHRKTT